MPPNRCGATSISRLAHPRAAFNRPTYPCQDLWSQIEALRLPSASALPTHIEASLLWVAQLEATTVTSTSRFEKIRRPSGIDGMISRLRAASAAQTAHGQPGMPFTCLTYAKGSGAISPDQRVYIVLILEFASEDETLMDLRKECHKASVRCALCPTVSGTYSAQGPSSYGNSDDKDGAYDRTAYLHIQLID
ncbi:hypothetical protein EVG20_g2444 [Dentipellis fragilis]|uniref:Uncharacterized protein n=1 Tax=Dentipellis fragilis TaxID=205917 RepID=A0A4Y9Z9V5_9AGAM|nr:hypothetical protein EVG20_g2444 [Dentipellis fragilis]